MASDAHYDIQRLKTMITLILDSAVQHYIESPSDNAIGAVIETRDRVISVLNNFQEEGEQR